MGAFPSAAAQIKPPEDPLEQYSKLVGIQSLAANQQLKQAQIQGAQLENQQRQIQVTQATRDAHDQEVTNKAFIDSGGDPAKFQTLLPQYGASFHAVQSAKATQAATVKALADSDESTFKAHKGANEIIGQGIQSILNAPPEDQAAQYTLVTNSLKRDPNLAKYIPQNLPPQYPGPDALKSAAIGVGMNDALMKQAEEGRKQALAVPQLATAQSEATIKGAEANAVQQGGAIPGVPLENQEANAWLKKNPGKDLADYGKYKASLNPIAQIQAANSAGGGLTDTAKDQAAERYWQTGVLPPTSRGAAGMVQSRAIMNRAAELHPEGSITANSAEYAANKASLTKLQSQFDQVNAFENTAGKNLDVFLKTAQPILDSGSPWINKPLRAVAQGALGSSDQAAFNAARTTAITEIAKVLNSSNASGVLSDSARHEVEGLIGPDANLKQIVSAANVLKKDMGNRHQSYQDQIDDIQRRLGGKPPASNTEKTTGSSSNSTGKAVSLAAAKQLPINKGKSDDEIRKDIESHGHTVTD